MAGLLYYIPNQTRGIAPQAVADLGLAYALGGVMWTAADIIQNGPDGGRGVVLADDKIVPCVGHFPEQQTWRKIPGSDVWVGMVTTAPPSPADLVRDQVLPGHLVKLADGQEWLVPVARGRREEEGDLRWTMNLPTTPTTCDEDGKWVAGGVSVAYRPLWEIAERFWDEWYEADTTEQETILDFANLNDAALLALATNYRVTITEVVLLGLFDSRCTVEILKAIIDWPVIEAWVKKKADAAGLNTAAGGAN